MVKLTIVADPSPDADKFQEWLKKRGGGCGLGPNSLKLSANGRISGETSIQQIMVFGSAVQSLVDKDVITGAIQVRLTLPADEYIREALLKMEDAPKEAQTVRMNSWAKAERRVARKRPGGHIDSHIKSGKTLPNVRLVKKNQSTFGVESNTPSPIFALSLVHSIAQRIGKMRSR